MSEIKTDICVIGAGSGGLSVAAGAVQMGARVVLIEGGEMGGDCLNTGCVPSKALLHAAGQGADFATAMAHVRRVIDQIAPHDSQARFEGLGCTVLRETARFVSPRTVHAGEARITARRFVIATGARPYVPEIKGLAAVPYLTSDTIWGLDARPDHLMILGGGPIGVEMAQAFRRLGAEVTLIDAAQVLGREDAEAAAHVKAALHGEGVRIVEGAEVDEVAGGVCLRLRNGEEITGSHLLIATGRVPSVAGLGLEAAGVAYDARGIVTNAALKTTNRRIYAIGDVGAGHPQFTHAAGYQAGVVVRSALFGLPVKVCLNHMPRVSYTTPELAQIGLTEAEARATYGRRLTVVRAEYAGNDRAIASAQGEGGFIKLMVVKNRPVGVTIVGPQAGEMIALWSLALTTNLKLSQIAGMIAPYPTLSELNKRVISAYFTPKLFANPRVKQVVQWVQWLWP